jgi:hypothetical protein
MAGGQGVAGSNPAVPTQVRGWFRSSDTGLWASMGTMLFPPGICPLTANQVWMRPSGRACGHRHGDLEAGVPVSLSVHQRWAPASLRDALCPPSHFEVRQTPLCSIQAHRRPPIYVFLVDLPVIDGGGRQLP